MQMKKALLVIDVQNEYFNGKLRVTYPSNSLDNILKVMDYAKKNDCIVLTNDRELKSRLERADVKVVSAELFARKFD